MPRFQPRPAESGAQVTPVSFDVEGIMLACPQQQSWELAGLKWAFMPVK